MLTLQDYERDYGADDKEEVLANIKKYGTDDRSKWVTPSAATTPPSAGLSPMLQTKSGMGQAVTATPTTNTPQTSTAKWMASPGGSVSSVGQSGTLQSTPAANSSFDRTAFRDTWMGSGVNTVDGMKQWLAANPQLAAGVQIVGPKQDKFQLPTGEIIDGVLAAGLGGGKAGPQWTGAGGTQNGVPVDSGSGIASAPGPMVNGVAGSGGNVPTGAMGELYQELLNRSKQGLAVDRNDPAVRSQADAFSANVERTRRNNLSDLAERGGPGANLRGEERLGVERAGQATGGFEAEIIGRQIAARRDEIARALEARKDILSQQEQLALQKELALMNQALQSRGLDLQGRSLDQSWQQALMQNNQFMSGLGLQAEDQASKWDAIRSGLV